MGDGRAIRRRSAGFTQAAREREGRASAFWGLPNGKVPLKFGGETDVIFKARTVARESMGGRSLEGSGWKMTAALESGAA